MTAVEYLIEQLEGSFSIIARAVGVKKYNEIVRKSLEMEKQQIIDAFDSTRIVFAEEYYNETYGSKESDDEFDVEKEMFELEQQLDIPSHMRWHNRTSSQTEISDEEYYKEVFYQKQVMNPYPSTKHLYTAWEKGFMECAKWYREQLKQLNDKTNG